MFTITSVIQPETLEEAYQTVSQRKNNIVLGGCTFLRMGSLKIGTAVDLSKLGLQYIKEQSDSIEIGGMTTLRELETHPLTMRYFSGIVPQAVSNILGVQFRNAATVGASVFSRYGFSDVITALAVLDTQVELCKGGVMPLETFLTKPYEKDILTKIVLRKSSRTASFQSLRKSASDFAVLNAAVSQLDGTWTIAVGARPNTAAVAKQASALLSQSGNGGDAVDRAAAAAAEELNFGTNMRGTAEYRKAMCRVLVKRAIMEVQACR